MSKQFDLICIGMALIDSIIRGFDPKPISASGYRAASASLNVGGEAVNEAVAAAKLGAKTAIVCALGRDGAGGMVRAFLRQYGVDESRASESPATPVTTMFVDAQGNRKSITNEAHRYNFHPERTPAAFADARGLILGSLFRAPFDDPQVIRQVLTAAKANGQTVFADTKLPNFRVLSLDDVSDSLPLVDCITPNEDEARYFTGKTEPEDMADVFLALGVGRVIVKLGGKGCLMKTKDKTVRLPAYDIQAVDATGAGDNFVAGFASEILRGTPEGEALRFANACGAICATAVGAGAALRSREQVLQFMEETPLKA